MTLSASALEDCWRQLEASTPSTDRHMRTIDVGVSVNGVQLLAAVDIGGLRHVLVPLRGDQRVRHSQAVDTALRIRERALDDGDSLRRYLDVGCQRPELNDAFTSVCADVVEAVENEPDRQIKAALRAIGRWRELFRTPRPRLSTEQLTGLYGELKLLIDLLGIDPSLTGAWTGPTGHRHDFSFEAHAVEVKVSATGDGNKVRIHGLDQLDPPPGGELDMMWLHVEIGSQGECIPDLVAAATRLADDEALLETRLEAAGYRVADTESYADVRFITRDTRWYQVGDGFPRLTVSMLEQAGLGHPVSDVHYTVDLAGADGCRLDATSVTARLSGLVGAQ
jgi:hypothetical protein